VLSSSWPSQIQFHSQKIYVAKPRDKRDQKGDSEPNCACPFEKPTTKCILLRILRIIDMFLEVGVHEAGKIAMLDLGLSSIDGSFEPIDA
jgi:hypothetical protein